MKKTLFISLILGMLTISGFIGNELVTPSNEKQFAKKIRVRVRRAMGRVIFAKITAFLVLAVHGEP